MILATITGLVVVTVASFATIGGEWASPLNTLLLIILTVLSTRNRTAVKEAKAEVQETKAIINRRDHQEIPPPDHAWKRRTDPPPEVKG